MTDEVKRRKKEEHTNVCHRCVFGIVRRVICWESDTWRNHFEIVSIRIMPKKIHGDGRHRLVRIRISIQRQIQNTFKMNHLRAAQIEHSKLQWVWTWRIRKCYIKRLWFIRRPKIVTINCCVLKDFIILSVVDVNHEDWCVIIWYNSIMNTTHSYNCMISQVWKWALISQADNRVMEDWRYKILKTFRVQLRKGRSCTPSEYHFIYGEWESMKDVVP